MNNGQLSIDNSQLPIGYKRTELGVIPEDWSVKTIGEMNTFVTSGSRGWATYYSEIGSPFVRITNMTRYEVDLDLEDLKYVKIPEDSSEGTRTALKVGDLLVSITADIGIVSYVDDRLPKPAYINQHIAMVRFNDANAGSKYVAYYLASNEPQKNFKSLTDQGAKAGMSLDTVRKIKFISPPLPEQQAIAKALSDVDGWVASLDALIAKKRDLKTAAMQQLLTGHTRLHGFTGEWEVKTIEEMEALKLVRLSRGKVISKKDISTIPGDYPIYSSSIHNDGLFGRYGTYMFDEELISWSVDGGGNFFYRPKHKFSVTNVCGFMRVLSAQINAKFLAFQLQLLHSAMKFDYQDKAHPSVIRKAYTIKWPCLEEQTAIATIFSDMDAEIATLEAERDKASAIKQGMMQELLTGKTRLV